MSCVKHVIDGLRAGARACAGAGAVSAYDWPEPHQSALLDFYGAPGTGLVRISLPYDMRLAWDTDTIVSTTVCHNLCADAMQDFLAGILKHYGMAGIRDHGLDLFGGLYNKRKIHGTDRWSVHAFGAAIDLNPTTNGLGVAWPEHATMPVEVVRMFEALGGTAGARWQRPDAMHFEFTKRR